MDSLAAEILGISIHALREEGDRLFRKLFNGRK